MSLTSERLQNYSLMIDQCSILNGISPIRCTVPIIIHLKKASLVACEIFSIYMLKMGRIAETIHAVCQNYIACQKWQGHQDFPQESIEFTQSKKTTKWPIELWTLKQEMDSPATTRESFSFSGKKILYRYTVHSSQPSMVHCIGWVALSLLICLFVRSFAHPLPPW